MELSRYTRLIEFDYTEEKFFDELLRNAIMVGIIDGKYFAKIILELQESIHQRFDKGIGNFFTGDTNAKYYQLFVKGSVYVISVYLYSLGPEKAFELISENLISKVYVDSIHYYNEIVKKG